MTMLAATQKNSECPTLHDMARVGQMLRDVADRRILPFFRKLEAGEIQTKQSSLDWVTVADQAAEKEITPALQAMFPGAAIIGEEAVAADPALLQGLRGDALSILVDPVDGTRNFASGLGLFAVMAAFVRAGVLLGSVIYDPILRDFAIAVRGGGAWLQNRDGAMQRLRLGATPAAKPLQQMEGCGLWAHLSGERRRRVAVNLTRFGAMAAYRCAGHEYRLLAGGRYDFSLYHKLAPWDHAPGVLLYQEAGGHCAHLDDGRPYDPKRQDGGLLCAPDPQLWQRIREVILADPAAEDE